MRPPSLLSLQKRLRPGRGRALPTFPTDVWVEASGYIGWKVDASVRGEIVCLRM